MVVVDDIPYITVDSTIVSRYLVDLVTSKKNIPLNLVSFLFLN